MKNILSNIDYNVLRSDNKVSKVSDYIKDSDNAMHDVLLKSALINLVRSDDYDWTSRYNDLSDDEVAEALINDFSIVEMRNDDLLEPSICKFRQNHWPFRTWKVNMDAYWNNEYMREVYDTKHNGITNNDPIISFNYVNGTAKTKGRLDGVVKEIPFSKVNANSIISEECDLDKTTFTYMHKYN